MFSAWCRALYFLPVTLTCVVAFFSLDDVLASPALPWRNLLASPNVVHNHDSVGPRTNVLASDLAG